MDASVLRTAGLGMVLALAAAACGGAAVEDAAVEEAAVEEAAEEEATLEEPPAVPPEGVAGPIVTVVGTGIPGVEGIGGPAAEAQLRSPVGLAFDAEGNLYIAERFNSRILRVDSSGTLTVAAGSLTEQGFARRGFSGDGGPATEAELADASAVAVGPDGNLYISDTGNHRVRMVDAEGIITTVAGDGEEGFSGDGGPATRASLHKPLGLALDADGNLYIWDDRNLRIRMVDRDGIITTVAGTGKVGAAPDGTPAIEAPLGTPSDHQPLGLEVDGAGRLLITDVWNNKIWMVDEEGLIRVVAGNGDGEYSGDGGPATEAGVNGPLDIALGPDGILYIATHSHVPVEGHRVRMVDPAGIITTVAGTGARGYSGDGGPATDAELNIPAGVAIGPDGNLYIADAANNVIRMVAL